MVTASLILAYVATIGPSVHPVTSDLSLQPQTPVRKKAAARTSSSPKSPPKARSPRTPTRAKPVLKRRKP